ncbi:MAG TPA: hypothetical protein VGL27_00020 [Negativicutes bacterium]
MRVDLTFIWLKTAFYIVHYGTIWVALTLLLSAFGAWRLTAVLNLHNMRMKEAKLSWYIAITNGTLAILVLIVNKFLE